jgi:DNA-binding transcriptional LysR family regulator
VEHPPLWEPKEVATMIKNIGQLEAYYWVARLGSFQAAAQKLGLTQPAISGRIKDLEKGLGFPLFKRSTRVVSCTIQGATMLEQVERILSLTQDLEEKAKNRRSLGGLLQLGVPDSFAVLCLPKLLKEIQAAHPRMNVAVTVDNSFMLTRRMLDGLLDIAILAKPQNTEHFRMVPLGLHDVTWVASPRTDLCCERILPRDLVNRPIITHPSPSNLFSILIDWFAESELYPSRIRTCNSINAIASLVSADVGIAILPSCLLEDECISMPLVRLNVRPLISPQPVYMAFSKGVIVSSAREILHVTRRILRETRFLNSERRELPMAQPVDWVFQSTASKVSVPDSRAP